MGAAHSLRDRNKTRAPIRRRRRSPSRKALKPLLIRFLVVTVALMIGTAMVGKVLRPIRLVSKEQRQRDQIVSDYKALHAQNQDLRRQLKYLQTKEGIAHEARKHGFVKPGEISLVITDAPAPK